LFGAAGVSRGGCSPARRVITRAAPEQGYRGGVTARRRLAATA
jgi:hypothetical protein